MFQSIHPFELISTRLAQVRKEAGVLIRVFFVEDGELDEEEAIRILAAIIKLSEGKNHVLLYDFNRKSILLSNIAKKLASVRNETDSHLLGRAFLTYNLQNNIEATHFIQYSKPLCETKIFRNETEALQWLRLKSEEIS